MSLTGQELLVGMSRLMKDYMAVTTTSAGASDGTTLVASALSSYADDALTGLYVRITSQGGTQYHVSRVSRFTGTTGTLEVKPAFSEQVDSGTEFELHRYHPVDKFNSLDEARLLVHPDLAQFIYDDTTTADGVSRDYPIPEAIRKGPAFVFAESPKSRAVDWNFLTGPEDDDEGDWEASNLAVTTVNRDYSDLLIPKFGDTCLGVSVAASTNGTLVQNVAGMRNGITAARAAGRTMTFARWVYTTTASKWTLKITDDSGTSTSRSHQGNGWEMLLVTRDISSTNTTVLRVTLDADNDANASVAFLNGSWFYFGTGQRVYECYDSRIVGRVRRDDSTQEVGLFETPLRGTQLRFIGRAPLSALGDEPTVQVTNVMEVDEPSAQFLYAEAVGVLFDGESVVAAMPEEMATKIATIRARRDRFAVRWPFRMPAGVALKGWT